MRAQIYPYKHALIVLLIPFILIGCSTPAPVDVKQPIANAMNGTASYVEAKRQYVEKLQQVLLQRDTTPSKYQLVAIIGPTWGIGDVMDMSNPVDLGTNVCRTPSITAAIAPVDWTAFPAYSTEIKLTSSAGLPASIAKFLGKDGKLGAKLEAATSGTFSFSDIQATIAARDAFEKGIVGGCKEYLDIHGGILIRGVVSAKEKFSSSRTINASAQLSIIDPLFDIKYDRDGSFSLEDKKIAPKMFLVTYYAPVSRGDGVPAPRSLTAAEITRLESIRIEGL